MRCSGSWRDWLDAEVIHDQGESNVTIPMAEQGGSAGTGVVAPFAQVVDQPLPGQDASLWEAIDPLVDARQHIPITSNCVEVVALLDGDGYEAKRHLHVLGLIHWRTQVEILNVNGHPLCMLRACGIP